MYELERWSGNNLPATWDKTSRAVGQARKGIRAELMIDDLKLDADLDFAAHAMMAVTQSDRMAVSLASQCSPLGQREIANIHSAFSSGAAYRVARRVQS